MVPAALADNQGAILWPQEGKKDRGQILTIITKSSLSMSVVTRSDQSGGSDNLEFNGANGEDLQNFLQASFSDHGSQKKNPSPLPKAFSPQHDVEVKKHEYGWSVKLVVPQECDDEQHTSHSQGVRRIGLNIPIDAGQKFQEIFEFALATASPTPQTLPLLFKLYCGGELPEGVFITDGEKFADKGEVVADIMRVDLPGPSLTNKPCEMTLDRLYPGFRGLLIEIERAQQAFPNATTFIRCLEDVSKKLNYFELTVIKPRTFADKLGSMLKDYSTNPAYCTCRYSPEPYLDQIGYPIILDVNTPNLQDEVLKVKDALRQLARENPDSSVNVFIKDDDPNATEIQIFFLNNYETTSLKDRYFEQHGNQDDDPGDDDPEGGWDDTEPV